MLTVFPPKGSPDFTHPDPLPEFEPYAYNYRGYVEHLCPTEDTYHYHVLCLFKEPTYMTQVKADYGRETHCEIPRDLHKAREYLFKMDEKHLPQDAPHEDGAFITQGCRTDWQAAVRSIDEGNTPAMVCRTFNASVARNLSALKEIYNNPIFEQVDPLAGKPLYGWQIEAKQILMGPHPARQILWIYSEEYGTGKSHFMQHMSTCVPTLLGNHEDARSAAFLIRPDTRIIWFDLDRMFHLNTQFTQQLERLSTGGLIEVSKFTPRQVQYWGHVVVTCNFPPPVEYADRCKGIQANLLF